MPLIAALTCALSVAFATVFGLNHVAEFSYTVSNGTLGASGGGGRTLDRGQFGVPLISLPNTFSLGDVKEPLTGGSVPSLPAISPGAALTSSTSPVTAAAAATIGNGATNALGAAALGLTGTFSVSSGGVAIPGLTLPSNALYTVDASNAAKRLVTTDANFGGAANTVSSVGLLNGLGLDPAAVGKLIGDGFYEQQLVTNQVLQLTGREFLPKLQ